MHKIIHYYNPSHRPQVIALWTSVFGYATAHNASALAIDKKLAVNDGLFFVAVVDDKVVGAILAGYDGHRGWLYSVAVHPDHRKAGIGTQLVRHAEEALTRLGCVKINLQIVEGNREVTGFYKSLGYAVEERISMGRKVEANIPEASE